METFENVLENPKVLMKKLLGNLVDTCRGLLQIRESDWFSRRWLFDRQRSERSRARWRIQRKNYIKYNFCAIEQVKFLLKQLDYSPSFSTSDSQLGTPSLIYYSLIENSSS